MTRNVYLRPGDKDTYDQRTVKELTLDVLRNDYVNSNWVNSFQYMRNFQPRIVLTDDDLFRHTDPRVVWNAGSAYRLDYICAIGRGIGLHAALRSIECNIEYNFDLCPRPYKKFSGKYAQLGADQANSLLHIGSRPGEEVYIFMCPRDALNIPPSSDDLPPPGHCTGETLLSPFHARVVSAYLAHCLSKVPGLNIYCDDADSIPMPPDPASWYFTNAL